MKNIISKYFGKIKYSGESHILVPIFFIFTFIALLNSLQIYYSLPVGNISPPNLFLTIISKLIYFCYFVALAYVIQQIVKKVHLTSKTFILWFVINFIFLGISFLVHEIINISADLLLFNKPIPSSFYAIFNNPYVWLEILVYVALLLSFYLIEHKRNSYVNEIKCSNLETQLIKSKLKEFRTNLHPTFLLNTLQTIRNLVREDRTQDANSILSLLSDFLRTTIYETEKEEITLNEEINYLKQYLAIEEIRNHKAIKVEYEISSIILNSVVPNFLLQPIVEELIYHPDSIKHALNRIAVKAKRIENMLEIIIDFRYNKKVSFIVDLVKKLSVLEITQVRLTQLYGERKALIINIKGDAIIEIVIMVPYQEREVESEGMLIMESVT